MLHFDILDQGRIGILPKLSCFKEDFYLAGGTALALYLGHRDSIDFDFFTHKFFDEEKLLIQLKSLFLDKILIVQRERQTITVIVNDNVKISFFHYPYSQIGDFCNSEYLNLASILDIACMKMSAICARSLMKDYVDLYYILQKYDILQILHLCKLKYPSLDIQVILKSLVYFDDIEDEPVYFKEGFKCNITEIQPFLQKEAKKALFLLK